MLTFEELKKLSYTKMPLPERANVIEIAAYGAMVKLYDDFKNGKIVKAYADAQTSYLKNAYEHNALKYNSATVMADRYNALEMSGLLTAAEKGDCPICREMVKILDGRRQT